MALVNVIIPIFNQRALLEQCVSSVLSAHLETDYHLTLVDDASTDKGIDELLLSLSKNPKVSYLRNSSKPRFYKIGKYRFAIASCVASADLEQ